MPHCNRATATACASDTSGAGTVITEKIASCPNPPLPIQIRNIFPGFIIFFGSNARFTACIVAISTGDA